MSFSRSLLRQTPGWRVQVLSRGYASPRGTPQPPAPLADKQPDSTSASTIQQSPNVPTTWSTSQNPKPEAYNSPRFTQVNLAQQPNARAAIGMVAEDPIRLVEGRKAVCDGGESGRNAAKGPASRATGERCREVVEEETRRLREGVWIFYGIPNDHGLRLHPPVVRAAAIVRGRPSYSLHGLGHGLGMDWASTISREVLC